MYQTEHIKFDCQACSHFLIMNSYQERIASHRMSWQDRIWHHCIARSDLRLLPYVHMTGCLTFFSQPNVSECLYTIPKGSFKNNYFPELWREERAPEKEVSGRPDWPGCFCVRGRFGPMCIVVMPLLYKRGSWDQWESGIVRGSLNYL